MIAHRFRRVRAAGFIALSIALAPPIPATSPSVAEAANVSTKETSLQRIQRSVARIDQEAKTPEGEAQVLKRLSAQFRVAEDSLRANHEAWALGYGEVAMVYGFARAARRQSATLPQQIVDMRRSGSDWKEIAKQFGVSIDAVATRVRRNESPRRTR